MDTLFYRWDISKEGNFLDFLVKFNEGRISTDLVCKPTVSQQYLHYKSWYQTNSKLLIVYIQGLKIKRICSKDKDCEQHLSKLRELILQWKYPTELLSTRFKWGYVEGRGGKGRKNGYTFSFGLSSCS